MRPLLFLGLQAEGNITIDSTTFAYTYNVTESNINDRALVDLSSHAQSRMWTCSHCPFDTYSKFYQYYGEFDYADRIIQSAFFGQEMELDRGNMDFGYYTKYGMKGRRRDMMYWRDPYLNISHNIHSNSTI